MFVNYLLLPKPPPRPKLRPLPELLPKPVPRELPLPKPPLRTPFDGLRVPNDLCEPEGEPKLLLLGARLDIAGELVGRNVVTVRTCE